MKHTTLAAALFLCVSLGPTATAAKPPAKPQPTAAAARSTVDSAAFAATSVAFIVHATILAPVDATLLVAPKKSRNMSIFNVLHRECIERLFCAMSIVLQKCNINEEENSDKTENDEEEQCSDTITQEVILCKRSNQKVGLVRSIHFVRSFFGGNFNHFDICCNVSFLQQATIRITLVRSPKGLPRFFNCVLIPLGPA